MPSQRSPRARRPLRDVLAIVAVAVAAAWGTAHAAGEDEAPAADPARGLRHLLETPYLPAALDEDLVREIWRVWPEPQRSQAEAADPAGRRALVFAHYGLDVRPGDAEGRPLQFVVGDDGAWHMNCFTCHGGHVAGQVVPGLPNAHLALQSLVEDGIRIKRLLGRPLARGDVAAALVPYGETVGTTNAVVFSISLLNFRDRDLNVVPPKGLPRLPHHDLDAPPWWHLKHRTHLYVDGFAKPNHRALMQFLLLPTNPREHVLAAEADFRHIEAWIRQVTPPPWPFAVDAEHAERGRLVFERACASCHGTYGPEGLYPNRLVPIEEVGTDRVRLDAITTADRTLYATSWLTAYDPEGVRLDPGGYVAPPLHGIWASAPYLHNGAVPTLWHLLHPEARPVAWRRDATAYDAERVGLVIETAAAVPPTTDGHARRQWFDTTRHGKSAAGHDFPAALSEEERTDLLEYLKTL
jgi:hypothetical protein